MTESARWCWLEGTDRGNTLCIAGKWQLVSLELIDASLRALAMPGKVLALEGSLLESIDTASALVLLRAIERAGIAPRALTAKGFAANHLRILELVQRSMTTGAAAPEPARRSVAHALGRKTVELGRLLTGHANFLGAIASGAWQIVRTPSTLRLKELTALIEQVCLNAIAVVSLVTMLIGVVIAYLLGLQAEKYGANIFVVDGVAIGATRELAPIIVAVIVAGRSGAAFTAQLGAMRLAEEIDAIRTLGLTPMQVVIMPRVLALVVALPLLVFLGDAMSLVGAMLVADPMLDITPLTFVERLREELSLKHVAVGLLKAPVFALFIAVIACRMGMTVDRDTRAVGLATTSTVVQSIVSVILLDATFAVMFQKLGI